MSKRLRFVLPLLLPTGLAAVLLMAPEFELPAMPTVQTHGPLAGGPVALVALDLRP